MTAELLRALTALGEVEGGVAYIAQDELPELLGRLATIQGRALQRLTTPAAPPPAPVPVPPEPKPAERPLLTVKQAAERLNRSTSWVYRRKPEIPHHVLPGGGIAFSEAGLERFLRGRSR